MKFRSLIPWCLFLFGLAYGCSTVDSASDPAGNPVAPMTKEPFVYNDMAVTTLEGLVGHSATEDGQWYFTAMGDTTGFAPRALIRYGKALGRSDLVEFAIVTADTYLSWANEVLQKWANGENVDAELGLVFAGAPSLVDAYTHTGQRHYIDFLSYRLVQVNEMILDDPSLIRPGGEFAIYGPFFTGGAIITLNAELAFAFTSVEGYTDPVRAELLSQAEQLLATFDDYRTEAGYYAKDQNIEVEAGENCNMLMAIASLYRATKKPVYLTQAQQLTTALEPLWQQSEGAYRNVLSDTYIGLAENNVIIYAQLLLHATAGEAKAPQALEKAQRFYEYVEKVLFRELPAEVPGGGPPGHENEGGFAVMLHDNQGAVDPWYWCSGCNFFALYNILLLNELSGNADPVATEP